MPVIAAIPNYNMGDHLRKLLPQVLAQGYDRVFVLDDGSTDDSVDVVNGFGGDVRLIRSEHNRGCTANRNQIIDHVGDNELIHFIDADMDLETDDIPDVARELAARYASSGVGAIGGLVSRADGSQEPYNFGPIFTLKSHLTSIPPLVDRFRHRPWLARAIQFVATPIAKSYPNVLATPSATPTDWLHEGNMLIHSGVYKAVGGYDVNMRNHGAQDLAIQLEKKGIKRHFDPSIKVTHHYIDVRGTKRRQQKAESIRYLLRKNGLAPFLTGRYR